MPGDKGTPRLFEHFSSMQNRLPIGETTISSPQRSQRGGTLFLISVAFVAPGEAHGSAHPAQYKSVKAIKRTENVTKAH
jgi:hypothetical protein